GGQQENDDCTRSQRHARGHPRIMVHPARSPPPSDFVIGRQFCKEPLSALDEFLCLFGHSRQSDLVRARHQRCLEAGAPDRIQVQPSRSLEWSLRCSPASRTTLPSTSELPIPASLPAAEASSSARRRSSRSTR